MRIEWQSMQTWAIELFTAAGLHEEAAINVVANLEYAERRGFSSHGYIRLPTYVSRIRAGGINRSPSIRVLRDLPALVVVDADAAIGAYSAMKCVDIAIEKAEKSGVGFVVARNANHFGAAGQYTDAMASRGFLGIALCNTDKLMCAPFGGRPVLGSNPLSIAVPSTDGVGPQLDMATTEASYGKILVARDQARQIPSGWAVNSDGAPTCEAQEALDGALLPAGGPKGFGLAFMIDCILALSGAETSDNVGPLYGNPGAPQRLGHAFIAFAVDAAQSQAEYAHRIQSLCSSVHESATRKSSRAPMVPGEPERAVLDSAEVWEASESTLRNIQDLSRDMGVPVPIELAPLD